MRLLQCRLQAWAIPVALAVGAAFGMMAMPAAAAVQRVEVLERGPFADGMQLRRRGRLTKRSAASRISRSTHAISGQRSHRRSEARAARCARPGGLRQRIRHAAAGKGPRPNAPLRRQQSRRISPFWDRWTAQSRPTTIRRPSPTRATDFSMRHGFTLLFSAWTWDVARRQPGVKPLVFAPPVARPMATAPDHRAGRKRIHRQRAGRHRDLCRHARPHLRARHA